MHNIDTNDLQIRLLEYWNIVGKNKHYLNSILDFVDRQIESLPNLTQMVNFLYKSYNPIKLKNPISMLLYESIFHVS